MPTNFDPLRVSTELREQLSSSVRKLGFFLGAGCSISAGIPGLLQLTKDVGPKLPAKVLPTYQRLAASAGSGGLEWILNRVRLIEEVVGSDPKAQIDAISGTEAKELDRAICKAVFEVVSASGKNITDYKSLASWIRLRGTYRLLGHLSPASGPRQC